MSNVNYEANLEARANLFKALGHPVRLLIINLIKLKPRHGEELAAILRLKPATISHHLTKLTDAGLIKAKKDQYYQTYSLVSTHLNLLLRDLVHLPQPTLEFGTEQDAYRQKVLKTFFRHGRLIQFPAQLKKRIIVLEKIAEAFEPEREYTEKEVNFILLDYNEDVASLRRGMIEQNLMTREKGIYVKVSTEEED
jgi:DNA-binding HxlR family transcriptional regulator